MFKENSARKMFTLKKALAGIIVFNIISAEFLLLTQVDDIKLRTDVENKEIIKAYTTIEENKWDISKNKDGSVIATLSEDGILTISGTGRMLDYYNKNTSWDSVKNKIVKIKIDNGVTNIGLNAFYECKNLVEIIIPDSVTNIGSYAFSGCSSLTEITIPNAVTSIGDSTFQGCSSLREIAIPSSVTSIGKNVFMGCSSLSEIIIPNSVTSIGNRVFYECVNLENIIIPDSVTSIGEKILYSSIITNIVDIQEEVLLPELLKRAQDETDILYSSKGFNLKNCTIEDGKIIVDDKKIATIEVLNGKLEGLKYITGYNEWDISKNGDKSVIATLSEDGILTVSGKGDMIDNQILDSVMKIKQVKIEEGVTNIGNRAFSYYSNLREITISNSVISIGDSAFSGCSSLTEITIPNSVTSIGWHAFLGCSSLTEILIPSGVASIGQKAFNSCKNLINIKVDENNAKYIDDNGVLYTKDKKQLIKYPEGKKDTTYIMLNNVTNIGDSAFNGCSNLKEIIIANSVISIENYAFSGCSSLTGIIIPESVTSMGNYAFNGCSSLTEITISNSVTSIGDSAFDGCSNLTEIIIPNSAIWIGLLAFNHCSSLTKIIIPNSVISIDDYAFNDCTNLTEIIIPNSVIGIGENAFDGCDSLRIICRDNSIAKTYAEENNIEYLIDDNGPTIKFTIEGTNGKALSSDTQIVVEDLIAGVDDSSIKYYLGIESEGITKEKIETSYTENEIITIPEVHGKYYLWVYVKDKLENETIKRSNEFEIDLKGPEANVNYSNKELTNQNVEVTVLVDEEIQEVEGWTLSQDKKSLTKEYTNNTTVDGENIILKDLLGNQTTVNVKILNIDRIAPEASVSYSNPNLTNQNVRVTITSNEEIQLVDGWALSENKKSLTKDFANNTSVNGENVIIKDLVGNEVAVNVKVLNIDKIVPESKVTYKLSNEKDICIVEITSNEEIQMLDGWILSENKKTLAKIYTNNMVEKVVLKDLAGNTKEVTIEVTGIETIFDTKYEIKETYIKKINPNTTYEEFIQNIETNKEYVVKEGNEIVSNKGMIKTGQVLTVGDKSYTIVVTGDINGDGKLKLSDLSKLKFAMIGKVELQGVYKEAADLNNDGKVKLSDLSKMKLQLLQNSTL